MTATWKTPGLFKGDPEKVKSELDTLGASFKPEDIVELAKNPNTELHRCFEWDDKIAADKYRISQARTLICNLVIDTSNQNDPTTTVPVRIFHQAEGASYKSLEFIVKNPNEYQAMLAKCRHELLALKNKYASLSEYQEIWDMIQ